MSKRSLKGGAEKGDNMDESLQEEIQRTHDLVKNFKQDTNKKWNGVKNFKNHLN